MPDPLNPGGEPAAAGAPQDQLYNDPPVGGEKPPEGQPPEGQLPEGQLPEGQPPITPDQLQNQLAAIQRKYQPMKEFIDSYNPDVKNAFESFIKTGEHPGTADVTPPYSTGALPAKPAEKPPVFESTGDPMLDAIAQMEQKFTSAIDAVNNKLDAREVAQSKHQVFNEWKNQVDEIGGQFDKWVKEQNIPEETLQKAYEQVQKMGVNPYRKDGPKGMVTALTTAIENIELRNFVSQFNAGNVANAEANVIAANQVAQPTPGALPAGSGETDAAAVVREVQEAKGGKSFADIVHGNA